MAFAFDTLGYTKRLHDAGIPRPQAEAHAEAAREFVMAELVTKQDLTLVFDNLTHAVDGREANLKLAMENLELSLTIRLGSMIAAGFGALALLTILQHFHRLAC